MPVRCMSIRQNKPEDNGSIYEIFSRLNTGGLNLSPQEIRGCLYRSDFYKMIYALNSEPDWRNLVGKAEEDDKFRDVEVLLRSYALLYDGSSYTGSMIRFLNRFSKEAQTFSTEKVEQSRQLFFDVLNICKSIDKKAFLTQTGSFNVSLFDSVFVTIAEKILADGFENAAITQTDFDALKADTKFKAAITHSTSHGESVKARLCLARRYLYGIALPDGEE